jgi:hypothetical protein
MGVQDPKSDKARLDLHDTILEGKSIGFNPPPSPLPKSQKGELMTWKTKMQANVQGMVQLKDSICFKWVQIGSYKFGHNKFCLQLHPMC